MSKDFMVEQLTQVFTYAELLKRLGECQELLDPKNGYAGEKEVHNLMEDLQVVIRKNLEIHLSNSHISKKAMTIINNMVVLGNMNKRLTAGEGNVLTVPLSSNL